MTVINMYDKIILCLLIMFVIVYSEEVSTIKNVETINFSNSRLSTVLPYPSLYNDEHLIKDNSKRSLVLLMPLSRTRNEHEKPKEIIQKTKRCGTQHRKNKFLLLSTKKDNNKVRKPDKDIEVGISKQNSDDNIIKNAKYSQEKSGATKRMIAETHEDEMLLQALKNNLNMEDVIINLKSQEKAKKCNTEKYICHCKEENCFSSSSKESSSEMLGSSRIDKFEGTNQRKPLTKCENVKPDILQQKSSILYHENPHELSLPNLINHFSIQPYQERINIPPVPVLYEIMPNLSHMDENERNINVRVPFTSFESRPNYLVGNNEYQSSVNKKPCICSPVTEKHRVESSISVTSPSTNYVDITTIRDTTNDLESNNMIGQIEDQEHFPKLTTEASNVDASANSETETNLHLTHSTNITEQSNTIDSVNSNEITPTLEDFTEQNERNSDNNLSKFTIYPTDYADTSTSSFIYDGTNDGKLINMEECIQLFGRDVCVLSATSPRMLVKQAQKNNPKYSTIKIPEYVTQMSAREETTFMNNYDKNKSFSTAKDTPIPIIKLMDQTTNEITRKEKNKLLGKSKSHTTKLLLNPNNEKIANSTLGEILYSTSSYESSNEANLKINQQNQITNSNSNTSSKEETTVTSYDSKEQKPRNYLKESNVDVHSEKIPQEHFKEETTTSSNFRTFGYNFGKETKEETIGIETSVYPGEIFQEHSRPTTMQYFNDKKLINLNHEEDTTNNFGALVDSSTSRLPFCDNTLLLNSIRKVINDFTLDPRFTKTKDFDENILQAQGKNLLPEILQVPNLKNILSMPQIENTIVEKVKDILSYVTAIPKRDFTNDWSHGVIKNTLHSILNDLSGFDHKLPSMTLEEHQFKDGQWTTNLVTLAPISDQKLTKGTPENLRESIKDLLSSPAIASQTDQHVVRNMIVQSVKNSLTNDKDDKIDDSIIYALNDVLQTLKDINALENSNEVISDEEDIDMISSQEIPTSKYEIGINIDNSILNNRENLDVKKDKMDNNRMQITDYQKAKILENNANILTTSEFPHLLQLSKEEEEEATNKAIKENIRDFEQIKKINMQDTEEKLVAPLKLKKTYHKAILQNNLATLEPDLMGTEQYIKNHRIDNKSVENTTITNFIQETSPNYAQVSNDDTVLENMAKTKNVGKEIEYILNEETLTTSTEIDPLIILERIKFNLPPTKYYSPEISKYPTNHHIDDKNVETTAASTNLVQETSSNYAQVLDGMILQNTAETKDDGDEVKYPLNTSGNLISSTNVEYRDYKPKSISLTDKNVLESQQNSQQNFTEDNIVKIHEVTTEIQRTYEKTTYFKGESSNDSPRVSSPSSTYATTGIRINNKNKENDNDNNDNDNNNLIGKMNNTDNVIKAKEIIVSSSKSSARDGIDPLQLFSSSVASDDISELQRSQLYYVSDGIKLPLEIKRLKDGSYALSISKNICEQILTRKCPCCVPLQGYVIRSFKNHQEEDMNAMTSTVTEKKDPENMYVNNIKRNYQSVQPFNTMITRRNVLTQKLKEEEEETEKKMNLYHPWKQNDHNLAIISMPVIDFAKKYNLLLDFDEKNILFNEGMQNKMQNYDKLEEKNLDNYSDKLFSENNDAIDKFQNLMVNLREKKDTPNMNFPITQKIFNLWKDSKEFEVRKANAKINQSKISEGSKLHEAKTANDVQNMNIIQKINSENQKRNLVLKEINIPERSKISKEEMEWNKLSDIVEGNARVYRKKENRKEENRDKAIESINNEHKKIRNFKENIGKPYRYQRNTNDVPNKRTELVKSMLYWLKGLFVDK